eukprot:11009665-Prorocentrum_lima.AAC.1
MSRSVNSFTGCRSISSPHPLPRHRVFILPHQDVSPGTPMGSSLAPLQVPPRPRLPPALMLGAPPFQ